MGVPVARQATEGHNPGLSGGLRAQHHRQETCRVCAVESRPEGQDAEDRLLEAG